MNTFIKTMTESDKMFARSFYYLMWEEQRLTQAEIIKKTAIPQSTLSAIINGTRKTTTERRKKIAECFKMTVDEFLTCAEEKQFRHPKMDSMNWSPEKRDPAESKKDGSGRYVTFSKQIILDVLSNVQKAASANHNNNTIKFDVENPPERFHAEIAAREIENFWYFKLALIMVGKEDWLNRTPQLAKKAGIPKQILKDIIDNKIMVPVDTQIAISKACGFDYKVFIELGKEQELLLKEKIFPADNQKNTLPVIKENAPDNPNDNIVTLEHQELVKGFKNKGKGLKANQLLIKLESLSRSKFYEYIAKLEATVEDLEERIELGARESMTAEELGEIQEEIAQEKKPKQKKA